MSVDGEVTEWDEPGMGMGPDGGMGRPGDGGFGDPGDDQGGFRPEPGDGGFGDEIAPRTDDESMDRV